MTDVDKKHRDRETLLDAMYDATDGSTSATVLLNDVAPNIGLDTAEADRAMTYLVDEGLAAWVAKGGLVSISHEGVRHVERRRAAPAPVLPNTPVPATPEPASAGPSVAAEAFRYRGLSRTSGIPPCLFTVPELRRLYGELQKKAEEALSRHLDSWQKPAGTPDDEFHKAKEQTRDVGRLTVAIRGADGEQIVAPSDDVFVEENLPDRLVSINFDSSIALQQFNVALPNRFRLYLDLSEPAAFPTYDPFQHPTPNASLLEVSGSDDTWVTAVYESTLAFFRKRKRRSGWLHRVATFTLATWLVGLPGCLWVAYRADSFLMSLLPNLPGGLRGAVDIYAFLAAFVVFRSALHAIRWIYPMVELRRARSSRGARRAVGALIGAISFALLVDVVKALIQAVVS